MPQPLVEVEISPQFQGRIEEEWLRAVAEVVLEREGPPKTVEVGIMVAGDEEVRELNHSYRGLDETTDVLSFALAEGDDFITPPDGVHHLGEVIISYPQAERQAQEEKKDIQQEIALLLVHGLLHLLGHDHADPEQEQAMRAKERTLLQAIPHGLAT